MSISYEEVPWEDSACSKAENVDFFPEPGKEYRTKIAEAKAVCKDCSIKMQCLEYSLENEEHGIWGGLSASERDSMRRSRRARKTIPVFIKSNRERSLQAAPAAITKLKEALDAVGNQALPEWVEAAKLRIDNPTKSLAEVASMANLNKDVYNGKLRRLVNLYESSK
jgi:WhiB family redox-sensing transcriptional regulator